MPQLVRLELNEFGNQLGRSQPRHEYLTGVNVYRTVLTGVIHLDDPAAKISGT